MIERYHVELRRAYEIIMTEKLDLNKESDLQMIVKTINDIAELDDLIFTLLIYEAYSRIHANDVSSAIISERAVVIQKVMIEIRRIRDKKMINNALNARNESIMNHLHDLSSESLVLI